MSPCGAAGVDDGGFSVCCCYPWLGARWVALVAFVRQFSWRPWWGRRSTYDFSSCFFPKFKIMHFQKGDIKLYTVVLLFLCFLEFLTKLCCR